MTPDRDLLCLLGISERMPHVFAILLALLCLHLMVRDGCRPQPTDPAEVTP